MSSNPHIGPSFDDLLREDGIYEDVNAGAIKQVLAWQIERSMKEQKISKTAMAKRMKTSRAAIDRLLDPENSAVTLHTLLSVAQCIGKQLRIEFV
jgi:hypothetical protein